MGFSLQYLSLSFSLNNIFRLPFNSYDTEVYIHVLLLSLDYSTYS